MEKEFEKFKTCDPSALIFQQKFWKALFEEHFIARRMSTLVCDNFAISEDCNPLFHTFCLKEYGVIKLKIKPASSLGDNFFSDAYLIEAVFLKNNISLNVFAKVMPGNSLLRQTVYESCAHQRENNIYKILFKALRQIRGKTNIPLDVPNFFYGQTGEMVDGRNDGSDTCILLEDLKQEGYQMVDKNKGLDENHVLLALTSLAHYHSLTITALRRLAQTNFLDYESKDKIKDHLFDQDLRNNQLKFLLEKTIADHDPVETIQPWLEIFIDLADDVNRPELSNWLSGLRERLSEIMQLDTYENSGPLACIVHGDFWSNNMLFKYANNDKGVQDGKCAIPIALKMVDFQIARISHPMSDILYFFYISTRSQLRKEKLQTWLELYFCTLLADLKLLQVDLDGYCWPHFLADYEKQSLRWMLYGGMIMALVHNNVVVDALMDLHHKEVEKETSKEPKCVERDNQSSSTLSTTLSATVKKNRLSCNPLLTEQLLSLFEEVRGLTAANC